MSENVKDDTYLKKIDSMIDELASAMVQPPPTRPTDEIRSGPVLQIDVKGAWTEVTRDVWNAWTGRRMLDGEEFHGPVFGFGTTQVARDVHRMCACKTCQDSINPVKRYN